MNQGICEHLLLRSKKTPGFRLSKKSSLIACTQEVNIQMMDEKTRVAIALKRFSLISPIINGQVSGIGEYCKEVTKEPIEMP